MRLSETLPKSFQKIQISRKSAQGFLNKMGFFKMLYYSNGLYFLSLGFIAFFKSIENKNDKFVKKRLKNGTKDA